MADISQINLPNGSGSTTYDINAKKLNGHDTPTIGDASSTQVVLGDDTRLSGNIKSIYARSNTLTPDENGQVSLQFLTYHVGTNINIRYGFYSGVLTSNKRTLTFFVPLSRQVDGNVTGATMSNNLASFTVWQSSETSISNSSGTWSFTVRNDGIVCSFTATSSMGLSYGQLTVEFPNSNSVITLT